MKENTCDTCNAPHTNTLHRIWIRCGTCAVINGKLPPTNWRPKESLQSALKGTT